MQMANRVRITTAGVAERNNRDTYPPKFGRRELSKTT
jgi:hypothetical protein